MEYNAPHPNAAFEGYYNKFDLPSGANLVLVTCKVANANERANAVTFTYVPKNQTQPYQKEIFAEAINIRRTSTTGHAFILEVPGIGSVRWNDDASTDYNLQHGEFSFQAKTTSRTPWSVNTETPEGFLVNIPLPLHWHVQTLASHCNFTLNIPGYDLPNDDVSGEAIVHQEKNWANAFPSGHMWIQGREGDRGICGAGGEILGMKAFLLGYRSSDLNLEFRPPFALRLAGLGPFMSYATDWEERTFRLSIQSFRQKIAIKATAPKGSFFPLSPPFPEGHRDNFLGQSLRAKIEVQIYKSSWLGPWRLVREDVFENAGLEFGGAYYPPAGTEKRFN